MDQADQYSAENVELNQLLKLRLQKAVFGREIEIEAIKEHFGTVLEGNSALALIYGDIGVGKTALVKKTMADLVKMQGTCVSGKFEQYKEEEPYIAIIQIIEDIVDIILTLPEAKLELIKIKLQKSLKKDSSLIAEIVPKVERVIGKQSKVKIDDYLKLKARLEKAFHVFIKIAAVELNPLVIFVDDVQWIDKPSWKIIKSLYEDFAGLNVFILMAYRNNQEEYISRIQSLLDGINRPENILKIELNCLPSETVKEILQKVFNDTLKNVHKLADQMQRKTLGNPLYLKQIINMLLEQKAIRYFPASGMWRLELENIDAARLPNGLKDIINRKINNLDHQAKKLLEIAACIGSRFDLELLKKIIDTNEEFLEEQLKALSDAGLIVETFGHSENDRVREFEFFHDQIYQNVYEQINSKLNMQIHFEIAMQLLKNTDRIYVKENLLSITAHLLKCKDIIIKEGIQEQLVVELYFAGVKAKQTAAIEHALKLFSFCEELLEESCWHKDYGNTLKIKLELAECEFICGLYNVSREHFEEMLANASENEDLVEIKKRYMILNSYNGEHAKVIDLGLEALKHLGFNFNMQNLNFNIAKELLYSKYLYRNRRLRFIENAPVINNKRIIKVLEILSIMGASANLINENLFTLIMLKSGNLSAKYGNSLYSPLGYTAYSIVLGSVMGDYQKANKVKDIALNVAELIDDNALNCTNYFIIGTLVEHWTASAESSFNYLEKSFDSGIQSGEFFFSGLAITSMIEMKYSMGESLTGLKQFLELHQKYGKKMNHDILLRLISFFNEHIRILTSIDSSLEDQLVDNQQISKLNTNEVMTYYLLKIQRFYLEGKLDEAYTLSEKTIEQLDSVNGYFMQVDFVFYFLLLCLEKKQKDGINKKNEKAFKKYRQKLKVWAQMTPGNHRGKHLLIEALYGSVNNPTLNAAKLYDEAIEDARVNHHLLLEALGNYLAANYYGCNRKVAKVYVLDAIGLFNEWGAIKIAYRIGMLYEINNVLAVNEVSATGIKDEIPVNFGRGNEISFGERLNDCQKELEVLELEESYNYFLNMVCREAKADFGAVFLEKEDQIKLEYQWHNGDETTVIAAGIDGREVVRLPKKVIRYSSRTYEEVIIETKPTEGLFANDDYIRSRDSISIICLPLQYKGIFAGLIYLECGKNYGFDLTTVDFIKGLSFHLVAKQALEKETFSNKTFLNGTVNEQLTERELEVLRCIAEGMASKEIGAKLSISLNTVKTHTLNIYGKLEAGSRVRAVSKAKALGLI